MRRIGALAAAVLCLGTSHAGANGYKSIAKEFSKAARREGVERVAVLPFIATDGSGPGDGWNISERLTTQLVRQGRVKTVERGMLRKVMEEQYLGRTGLIDSSTLKKLGRILAVDAIVTGSFVSAGREVNVNARLIHVETGLIIAASEESVLREWHGGSSLEAEALFASLAAPAAAPRRSARAQQAFEATPSPGEGTDLRDAPADAADGVSSAFECSGAREKVNSLESSILDLKARYWARQVKKGLSMALVRRNAGATIIDPDLLRSFYEKVGAYAQGDEFLALTPSEVKRFITADEGAFHLRHDCGI